MMFLAFLSDILRARALKTYKLPSLARPCPAKPDLARPHLVGLVGCSWVWLGVVGCDGACLQNRSVSADLLLFLPGTTSSETQAVNNVINYVAILVSHY